MSGQLSPRIPNTRLQFVGVGIILAFVFFVTMYFSAGERVKPNDPNKAFNHPDVHKGPPFTGVYLKYDSSKYTKSDGTVFIPNDDILFQMDLGELEELYHRFQENMQISCPLQLHVGDEFVGGYHICEPYVEKKNCLAYSFGTKRELSFDDGLVALFGCKVHTFVPTDGDDDGKHLDGVTVHKMGLGGRNELVKTDTKTYSIIYTFDSLRQQTGNLNTPIDIVKIDIAGDEWLSLRQMLDSKSLQDAKVKTLIVTFDIVAEKRDKPSYLYMLKILRELDDLGYKRFFFRMWWQNCVIRDLSTKLERTGCHEVHFLKV